MKTIRKSILLISGCLLLAAGTLSAQPVVTEVLDVCALTPNIAPGSVFAVKGTGLSVFGTVAATAPSYPTTLNNVKISLTLASGGTAIAVPLVYTYNHIDDSALPAEQRLNQLAAVIPSSVAPGSYDLRVTVGSTTSSPFRISVVARKFGIATADQKGVAGSGVAQATLEGALILQRESVQPKYGDYSFRPAHPGDRMDLWGTGIGADLASDTGGTSGDQTAAGQIRVLVDGVEVTPLYAGRAQGYPGLDQVVFIIPTNVTLKCNNTIQVRAGGALGNVTTIATSAPNATFCPPPNTGGGGGGGNGNTNITPTQSEINSWIAAGKFRVGSVTLSRSTSYTTAAVVGTVTTTKDDSVDASFSSISGTSTNLANYLNAYSNAASSIGSCTVLTNISTNPFPGLTLTSLDAGTPIGISGPNGSRSIPRETNSGPTGTTYSYSLDLGSSASYLSSGNYTVTVPGSSSVAAFNGSLTVPSEFSWTNRTSVGTVNRGQGVRVTWSGGDSGGYMNISGSSSSFTGSSIAIGTFSCTAKMSDGQFTVPSSVLNQLPATGTTGGFITSYGNLTLDASGTPTRVSVNGLDYATISSDVSVDQSTIYQ